MIIDVFSYLPTTVHMRYMLNTFAATPDYLYTVFGKTIAQVCGVSPEEFQRLKQLPDVHAFAGALAARAGEGYPVENFVQDLERMGVASIIVHGEDNETTLGVTPIPNDYWAEVMRKFPGKIVALAGADPHKGARAVAEFERAVRELGFKGLWVVPFQHRIYADDPRYGALFGKCQELGVPLLIHSGVNWDSASPMDYCAPRHLDRLAVEFPELTIIASHAGWPWILDMVTVAWRHRHVYLEISAHNPRYFTRPGAGWEPLLHFGNSTIQEKVMFGSAWFLMGRSIEALAQDVRALPLKPEVVEKWLSGNAKRVFQLA